MTLDWEKTREWDRLEEDVQEDLDWLELMYGLPRYYYTNMEMYEYGKEKRRLEEELSILKG